MSIDLVKQTLWLLRSSQEDSSPESRELIQAFSNYIEACDTNFLAMQKIQFILKCGLFVNMLIAAILFILTSFIALPAAVSIGFGISLALIMSMFSFANILNQPKEYTSALQKSTWDKLKKHCLDYSNKQEKNFSATSSSSSSSFCMFSAQNDENQQDNNESPCQTSPKLPFSPP